MPAPLPQATRKSGIARFGVFEADLTARELRKHGTRLRIQEQPFAVLTILLERAGTVVTRDELREKLWPADTFVDFDHSLNTAVNKIREALGDAAGNPRFIETLARRGYRFLAEVQWQAEAQPSQLETAPVTVAVAKPRAGLPTPHRALTRSLFILIQAMYLIFYVEALLHWQAIDRISWIDTGAPTIMVVALVTAGVGIPVRLFLLSAAAFDYAQLGEKFLRIFLGLLVLDQLWAIAPFLLLAKIGFGAAFAATAALLYVPFAERTLIRMAYKTAR